MNEEDKNKRIKQMCSFIIQEAKEKVNEIKLKTENDFALEKQMMVHNAKLQLQAQFKQKEKDIEVERKIAVAKAEGASRVLKMNARESLIIDIKDTAVKALDKVTKDKSRYKEVLRKLIIQGLIKLNEPEVTVLCREADKKLVESLKSAVVEEYAKIIMEATGQQAKTTLMVNPNGEHLPPADDGSGAKSCAGGVKLLAHNGNLILDNTLDSRVGICYEQLMPVIRSTLFTTKV